MKKLLIFALCVLLVLSFASCGETSSQSSAEESSVSGDSSGESSAEESSVAEAEAQKKKEFREKYGNETPFIQKGNIFTCTYLASEDRGEGGVKYGLITYDGIVLEIEYDSITLLENGALLVSKDGKYAIIKLDGTVVFDYKYSSAEYIEYRPNNYYIEFHNDDECVFVDLEGNVLVEGYSYVNRYGDDFIVEKDGQQYILFMPAGTTAKIEDGVYVQGPIEDGSEYYLTVDISGVDFSEEEEVRFGAKYGVVKDGRVILRTEYEDIQLVHGEGRDWFIAYRDLLNHAALYDMRGYRISKEYEAIKYHGDYFEAKVDEDVFIKLGLSGNEEPSEEYSQEELRQKFEDCIKITQSYWEAKDENIANFPFEVTFYKPDDEPEESDDRVHYYLLMFRLKEKFKEYTTYKIRVFTDYYNEEFCNSGECDPEYIFSTMSVTYGRVFRISFELHGEGLEPIISGDDVWSFLYGYIDNSEEQYGDDSIWDDSKPIKILFSDIDSFDY